MNRAVAVGVLALASCQVDTTKNARPVDVKQEDMVMDVEVTGSLKAVDAENLSAPGIPDTWEFKIVRMAPEGSQVEAGAEVIAFDPSELEKKLLDQQNEAASLAEELAKRKAEVALAELNDKLSMEDAEAARRKAELKADKPADLSAANAARLAAIERDLARREIELRQGKVTATRRSEAAELRDIGERLARARTRVEEAQGFLRDLKVKASRAGTVVYKQGWRDEPPKVGDSVSRGDSVISVASLDRMAASGQVDEIDASHVHVGQRVGLRLEAHPDVEYAGTVEKVATLVVNESYQSRLKVAKLELRLEKTDPALMRPGMRFRGRIEIERVPGVTQVPIAAVQHGPGGPTVRLLAGRGAKPVVIRMGRRSREAVEVLAGVRSGDRVLVDEPTDAPETATRGGRP